MLTVSLLCGAAETVKEFFAIGREQLYVRVDGKGRFEQARRGSVT